MDDEKIIELFCRRDESALGELRDKYGALILRLAERITGSRADAEECLSDALLNLWNAIPPARPESLGAYAAASARNLAFKRLGYSLAKRRSVNSSVALDELEAVIADKNAEAELKDVDFHVLLDGFLQSLSVESRVVFMKRYFFMDSVGEIAEDLNISESKVKSLLFRARKKLKRTIYGE